MSLTERYYPEVRTQGYTHVDGTVAFYTQVRERLSPSAVVIDFGCGRGAYQDDPVPARRALRILKGTATKVIGLDRDPAARDNPFLDEFHLLDGDQWPVDSEVADVVLCDNVLEHLERPQDFFRQANRALKPGGHICIRTPNRWGYVALAARLLPHHTHRGVLGRMKSRLNLADAFPTHYRCNSLASIRSALGRHGFSALVYGYEAEPSYLDFSPILYAAGVLHQRYAPRWLKLAIFAFGEKCGPLSQYNLSRA